MDSSKPRSGSDNLTKILAAVAGILVLAVVASGAFYAGEQNGNGGKTSAKPIGNGSPVSQQYDYSILNDIRSILGKDYVKQENIDDQSLYEAAINGMLDVFQDSGTYYVDPDTYKVNVLPSGTFEGIGATISQQGQDIVVTNPIKGTPAEAAGIKAGDIILSVEGESTKGWTTEKTVLKIRGPKGTKVNLEVKHADGKNESYTLTRAPINVETVTTAPPANGFKDSTGSEISGLGYMKIREFNTRTPGEVDDAIKEVEKNGAKGLIIDLRGNPGGVLSATVSIADMFLDTGTIVTQRERDGRERVFSAKNGQNTKAPIVIIMNKFSASASEVLAAALQENGRATVVGEKSFGKATVNIARDLRDGGAVFVSIANWLTPKGGLIDKSGIQPDIEVIPSDEDIDLKRDPQMAKAVDILKGQVRANAGP